MIAGFTFCSGVALGWMLEYIVTLLKFEEAMEDRIESSHFSPPLSKQRVEHARTLINDLEAKTLVLDLTYDFRVMLIIRYSNDRLCEHRAGGSGMWLWVSIGGPSKRVQHAGTHDWH